MECALDNTTGQKSCQPQLGYEGEAEVLQGDGGVIPRMRNKKDGHLCHPIIGSATDLSYSSRHLPHSYLCFRTRQGESIRKQATTYRTVGA